MKPQRIIILKGCLQRAILLWGKARSNENLSFKNLQKAFGLASGCDSSVKRSSWRWWTVISTLAPKCLALKFCSSLRGSWIPWRNGFFQSGAGKEWGDAGTSYTWKIRMYLKTEKEMSERHRGAVWRSPTGHLWDNLSIRRTNETATVMNYNALKLRGLPNTCRRNN